MWRQEEELKRARAFMANMGNAQAQADKACATPLAILREEIRMGLQRNGTDLEKYKLDKQGDGDQSPITLPEPQKQWYRDLFGSGGDLYAHLFTMGSLQPALSDFGLACIMGKIDMVTRMLKKVAAPDKQAALTTMLETRETSLRLSPLLLLVTMGKTFPHVSPADHFAVCKVLLQYGARVDAKDVGGKTICHYGSGTAATKTTLQMVQYCVQAHASSHFLNQEVELHSLQNAARNGKTGVARGYNVDTKRRVVYLLLQGGEISTTPVGIKPKNLKLLNHQTSSRKKLSNLCDVQDRLGGVCLLEVFMSSRTDVAKYLLDTLGASVDVADWSGYSPKSMSLRPAGQMASAVGPIIMKHMMKEGRKAKKAALKSCEQCGASDKTLSNCSRCYSVSYCSQACQTIHWKAGHKQLCKQLVQEKESFIVLEKPPLPPGMNIYSLNFKSGKTEANGTYRKPQSVKVNEPFYIKIQGSGDMQDLLIYDKSRECQFYYPSSLRGYTKMHAKVKADPACQGRKTYMAASFDSEGNCKVHPGHTTVQPW